MDVLRWIIKNKIKAIILALVLIVIIPFAIDKIFSISASIEIFSVSYSASDVLSYYGAALGSTVTIVGLIATIQHTEKMHSQDYERNLTPLLSSNIFRNKDAKTSLLVVKYINVIPNRIFHDIKIFDSIDPNDLVDTLFYSQIDYLVQNVSQTSAVDIKIFINDMLLFGPFSLIPGTETSVGIRFFAELYTNPFGETSFNIRVEYTNSIKSKLYRQTECLHICSCMRIFDHEPIEPVYEKRTGLSSQTVEDI